MSNLIPPLLSSSPPPMVSSLDEDEDDEFGDFRAATNAYEDDDFSTPPSPLQSPKADSKAEINLDVNSNTPQKLCPKNVPDHEKDQFITSDEMEKDFQDKRKVSETDSVQSNEIQVNSDHSQSTTPTPTHQTVHNGDDLVEDIQLKPEIEIVDVVDDFDLECRVPNPEIESSIVQEDTKGEEVLEELEESVEQPITTSESIQLDNSNEINSFKETEQDVEFFNFPEQKEVLAEPAIQVSNCQDGPSDDDDDDEFGDFEDHFNDEEDSKSVDFDEFVSPLPNNSEPPSINVAPNDEDDFGDFESSDLPTDDNFTDFGDFSAHTSGDFESKPPMLSMDEKDAFEKTETILKEIFPVSDGDIDEFNYRDETRSNSIFNELEDVTETNALTYQWAKSHSQKKFLKALNIDLRNILYGPSWNSSIPRFAANLGLAPLEPVKSDILTPTPVLAPNAASPSNSSQKSDNIPTAQFDWTGSGLVNPLDYSQTLLLDLEQLVASLDIPSTTNPNPSSNRSTSPELLDEWDLWLQSASAPPPAAETPSVKSISSPANLAAPILDFDVDSLQTAIKEPNSDSESLNNLELPSVNDSKPLDDFSQFESPKMIPLRETHIANDFGNGALSNRLDWMPSAILTTPDLPSKDLSLENDDDEFDDFQMVLPQQNPTVSNDPLPVVDEFEIQPMGKQKLEEHIFELKPAAVLMQPNILSQGPIDSPVQKQLSNDDDDEFTEFHSSLPSASQAKPLEVVPLEPLKPSIQYTTPVLSTQINWPDPGVSDEDIRNIELTYSRKENENDQVQTVVRKSSFEDEEWSDFISVTNPVKQMMPERTATPDLPLSVLNLNHVQAPKQPIPVITPAGLMQTKLASNMSNVVQTTLPSNNLYRPQGAEFQPSIISNQFAGFSPVHSVNKGAKSSENDDDDWSDFVSSPLPQIANGFQSQKNVNVKGAPVNWTSPNIIMNPTHSLQSFQQQSVRKVQPVPARNAIPSISAIPELDFIAPKNRTSKK